MQYELKWNEGSLRTSETDTSRICPFLFTLECNVANFELQCGILYMSKFFCHEQECVWSDDELRGELSSTAFLSRRMDGKVVWDNIFLSLLQFGGVLVLYLLTLYWQCACLNSNNMTICVLLFSTLPWLPSASLALEKQSVMEVLSRGQWCNFRREGVFNSHKKVQEFGRSTCKGQTITWNQTFYSKKPPKFLMSVFASRYESRLVWLEEVEICWLIQRFMLVWTLFRFAP